MNFSIKSLDHLISLLYTSLKQYNNCILELKEKNVSDNSIFFVSTILNEELRSLSICVGTKSIGNIILTKSQEMLYNWVQDTCNDIFRNEFPSDTLTLIIKNKEVNYEEDDYDNDETEEELEFTNFDPEGYYDIIDYRDEYLTKHNRIRMLQNPLKISNIDQAIKLFTEFLKKDKCNKIIFSICIYIPDLDHEVIMDINIDKLYTYGRTLISFIISRPDIGDLEFTDMNDIIMEYDYKSKANIQSLLYNFNVIITNCFYRCLVLSKENVNIYVYSNYKFK